MGRAPSPGGEWWKLWGVLATGGPAPGTLASLEVLSLVPVHVLSPSGHVHG